MKYLLALVFSFMIGFACAGTPPTTSLHYANGDSSAPSTMGFNLLDLGNQAACDGPGGSPCLLFLGAKSNNIPAVKAAVSAACPNGVLDPAIWGFFAIDEPHDGQISTMITIVDYIHANCPHRSGTLTGGAPIFVDAYDISTVENHPRYYITGGTATNPVSNIHMNAANDYVGVEGYCARSDQFDVQCIDRAVASITANGWPLRRVVPVYQAFGNYPGGNWVCPTVAQFNAMMAEWGSLLPNPVFEFIYSWAVQSGDNAMSQGCTRTQKPWQTHIAP